MLLGRSLKVIGKVSGTGCTKDCTDGRQMSRVFRCRLGERTKPDQHSSHQRQRIKARTLPSNAGAYVVGVGFFRDAVNPPAKPAPPHTQSGFEGPDCGALAELNVYLDRQSQTAVFIRCPKGFALVGGNKT